MFQRRSVSSLTKPKNRVLKWTIFIILAIILGVGSWIGAIAYRSINKITADSGNNNFLSIFDATSRESLKGEAEGRTNILLLGNGGSNHPGGGLSDTMIVASINWQNKKMAMISIPRDLWVQIPGYGYSKLNGTFAYGNQNPKKTGGGGKVASDVISSVLGIPIHYYASIDFEGFQKMIDKLGGVDILVEKDLYDPLYPAPNMIDYAPFKISAGLHHMDGATALKYARSRETTSDFDRSRRQEQVLVAIKERVLSSGTLANPVKITELLNIMGSHIRTSFSIGEIRSLWDEIKSVDTENIINKVFDTSANSPLTGLTDERGYIIIPKKGVGNYTELQKIAQNIFSAQPVVDKDFKIEILNGTNKTGLATQVSQLLQSYGYQVTKVGNSTVPASTTTIYNCAGKSADLTVQDLAQTLKATVKTKTACQNIDIQIILGQNSL